MKIVDRAWGYYEEYMRCDTSVFKKLYVYPGKSLSKQYHKKRNEFWYVERGKGTVKLNSELHDLRVGDSVSIVKNCVHHLTNTSDEMLVVVEMQYGEECIEEDIVRL